VTHIVRPFRIAVADTGGKNASHSYVRCGLTVLSLSLDFCAFTGRGGFIDAYAFGHANYSKKFNLDVLLGTLSHGVLLEMSGRAFKPWCLIATFC
jgi:hypothetical protein